MLTLAVWAENGGIIGRGILLDYRDWAERHSVPLDPLTSVGIPFAHLQSVIKERDITFRPGDILFIRSGFTAAYNSLSDLEQKSLSERPTADFIGVEPSREILQWLWGNQFAAVAGDSPSFERSPVTGPHVDPDIILHQWLLGGWGMPIGEMFDLERLAEHCKKEQRHTFFLTSVPLKVRFMQLQELRT